jgi:choline-sulfatase
MSTAYQEIDCIQSGAKIHFAIDMGSRTEENRQNQLTRRQFLEVSGASVSLGMAAEGMPAPGVVPEHRPTEDGVRKPNIILFMPDELRAESLACYGNPVVQTPNFDLLASEGTRFSRCSVQYPICGASRCSLLTGWPTSVRGHRSQFYFLRPHEPNLFRYLKENGYDVVWFGKNDALDPRSFTQSVTVWNYIDGSPIPGGRGMPGNPWAFDDPRRYSFLYGEGGDRRQYLDYAHVQAAIRTLERQGNRPVCIFLALTSPHPPYSAPQGFHDKYKPADLPPLRPIGLPHKPSFFPAIREACGLGKLDAEVFRQIQAIYLGMVSYTDWLLGELMEALERTGHARDTALFTLSDHGDYAGDYGLVEKWPSGVEDVLTRVPLIARVPGGARGHIAEGIVELYDVMATCLDLAGIEAQHTHFARSLTPQLHGARGDPARCAFCEGGFNTYEPQCFEPVEAPESIYHARLKLEMDHPETISRTAMVRTPNYKLVLRPAGQCELYDLREDARELYNLYGEQSTRSVEEDLRARLLNWYINTTGVAPPDKDQRGAPPYIPTPSFRNPNWQRDNEV